MTPLNNACIPPEPTRYPNLYLSCYNSTYFIAVDLILDFLNSPDRFAVTETSDSKALRLCPLSVSEASIDNKSFQLSERPECGTA